MAIKLTSSEIDKKYYNKKQLKNKQIKLNIPNLYLWVTKNGKCTFRFKLYMDGKFSWATLGKHPFMTVSDAVAKSYEMQSKRDAGVNPNQEKREFAQKNIKLSDLIEDYKTISSKTTAKAESTKKYNGKIVGYPDGQYVGECLSLAKLYIKECFGI